MGAQGAAAVTTNATAIRDAVFTRAQATGKWGLARKTDVPSVAGADLPVLQVFLLSEEMGPDGDANVGPPRFISDVTIAISVLRGFDDPAVIDGSIDADVSAILDALLTDPTFVHGMPQLSLFEGVERARRRRLYPQAGETYALELRLELTFRYRCFFEPVAPNLLQQVSVAIPPFPGASALFNITGDVMIVMVGQLFVIASINCVTGALLRGAGQLVAKAT